MAPGSKPGLTLVGAGRVGGVLGRLLVARGYPLGAVADTDPDRARLLVERIGAGTPAPADGYSVEEIVLFCVPDDALAAAASDLAARTNARMPRVALHTSGAHGAGVLAPLAKRGVSVGSMHPIHAFSAHGEGEGLEGIRYGLSGYGKALDTARAIVADLGGRPLVLPPDAGPLYHAACCFASNAVVAAMATAVRLLESAGIDTEEARAALGPLLLQTARDLAEAGPGKSVTGPVVRGDARTVALHLAKLAEAGDETAVRFYRAFSMALADLARQEDLLRGEALERLRDLLES